VNPRSDIDGQYPESDPQFPMECKMNYLSLALTTLGGTVASFGFGFVVMWLAPALFEASHHNPAARPKEQMMSVAPIGFGASIIAILVVAIIFAMTYQRGSGIAEGARLGVLIGVLAACHVANNYMSMNIGLNFALGLAATYLVQWTITGIVIALIYRPLA
jgi:hypothetical protein